MADEIDEVTAAEFGHAFVRWVIDEDPGEVARLLPALDAGTIDDARAARVGRSIVNLLQQIDVA